MASIVDAFTSDGNVTIKIADLKQLFRDNALNYAQNTCMINGLKAGLKHEDILIMIGKNKESEDI